MEIDEIEDKIACGEMTAAQVFTQMKQHIGNEYEVEIFNLTGFANIDGIRYVKGDIFDKLLIEHRALKEKS